MAGVLAAVAGLDSVFPMVLVLEGGWRDGADPALVMLAEAMLLVLLLLPDDRLCAGVEGLLVTVGDGVPEDLCGAEPEFVLVDLADLTVGDCDTGVDDKVLDDRCAAGDVIGEAVMPAPVMDWPARLAVVSCGRTGTGFPLVDGTLW